MRRARASKRERDEHLRTCVGPWEVRLARPQVFLKEIKEKSGVHRFTVQSDKRELKLRAAKCAAE